MKIFIDANIYLNYFRQGKAPLSSLQELKKLVRRKRLKLLLPAQTRDEYVRNRNGIAEQSRELILRAIDSSLVFPASFIRSWPEATRVQKRQDATNKAYRDLLRKYDATVSVERTPADILIQRLFATAEVLQDDDAIVRKAYFRHLRGHPPRKNNLSIGDAISWELLLAGAEDNLVIITGDGDYAERRAGAICLNGFLEKEWKAKCRGKTIELYNSLGEFINAFEKRQAVKNDVVKKEKELLQSATISYGAGVPVPLNNAGAFLTVPTLGVPNNMSMVMNNLPFLTMPTVFDFGVGQPGSLLTHALEPIKNPYVRDPFFVSNTQNFVLPSDPVSFAGNQEVTRAGLAKHCQACSRNVTAAFLAFSVSGEALTRKFKCPHCGSEEVV